MQKRTMDAEQETERAYKQIDKLKKNHEKEISALNELLANSRLHREARQQPVYDEAFEEYACDHSGEDGELPKLTETSSWFSGYDRCNI